MPSGCSQPAAPGQKSEANASGLAPKEVQEPVGKGENVIPVKSQATPLSVQKLLSTIPQDKLPLPGPDGASARDAANAWLTQEAAGKTVEVAFRVSDLEIGNGEQSNTLYVTPKALGPNEIPERLIPGGISVEQTTAGGHPCQVKVTGQEPTWNNIPRDQLEKYEGMKGKVVKFRGKIVTAQLHPGDNDKQLQCYLELTEIQPVFESILAENTKAPANPTGNNSPEKSATFEVDKSLLAAVDQAIKQMPKPLTAQEMPEQPAIPSGMDMLVAANDFFPLRRLVGPVVDGKEHGECRAYAPHRQLILVQNAVEGKQHGLQRTFYPNGKPFSMMNFVHGKADGIAYFFYESGLLRSFSTWKEGVQHGPSAIYDDTGKLGVLYEMKQGKAEGMRYHYLPSGPLFGITRWENDKQVAQEYLGGVNTNFLSVDSLDNIERQSRRHGKVLKDYWTTNRSIDHKPVKTENKVGEWKSLFNGKNLGGWWPPLDPKEGNKNPLDLLAAWEVKDGILLGTPQKNITALLYDECFANFHLRAEVRIDDKTDAGITFRLPHFYSGIHSGWKQVQIATNHQYLFTGSVIPSPQSANRQKNPLLHKPGEWFTLELIVQDKHVVTKVNGTVATDIMMTHNNHTQFHPLGHVGLMLQRVPPPPVRGRRVGDEPIDPTAKVEFRKIEIMPLAD